MNCPYCDETISALAKFCPKCGLPLKDDATVMGAYVSDDGPNWMLIGGGAAAVVAIAASIGFLSSQSGKTQTVRQEVGRPGQPAAAPVFGAPVAAYGLTPNTGFAPLNVNAANSMTNTKPRWAYTPPPTPVAQPVWQVPMVVQAPQHVALMAPQVWRRPPVVQIARSTTPAVPAIPPSEINLMMTPSAPAYVESTPAAALNSEIARREATGVWVYDPVQERWARRPEVRRRSTSPARRTSPVPAPVDDFVGAPPAPVENTGPIE